MSKKDGIKNLSNIDDDDDEDDEDYVPDNVESESEDDQTSLKRKNESDEEESNTKSMKSDVHETEESKKKVDEIWASFLKDVKSVPVRQTSDYGKKYQVHSDDKAKPSESKTNQRTDFFSGFESKTEPQVKSSEPSVPKDEEEKPKKNKPLGLSGILEKIAKQEKFSTLGKSKSDWEEFKQEQKIEDELANRSKGKESYLDKQAFLERADLRQFEIEKEIRNKERKQRDAKF